MKSLPILWKRLVKNGETCPRCGDTGKELRSAVSKLASALRPLGIEPVLETQEIDEATFKANTSESNRVWIAGRPIEDWLGAEVGMSPCCKACGDSDCRTIELGGETYETIPEEQIIKAGLMAASHLITAAPEQTRTSCCDTSTTTQSCQSEQITAEGGCCG